mmetsp:Transcript_31813/g.84975  ORF Transcript_31813/g.84975 Transcript_31813/m.84975 type:complete len:206 (-) Transcript_31813:1909-2526(-)
MVWLVTKEHGGVKHQRMQNSWVRMLYIQPSGPEMVKLMMPANAQSCSARPCGTCSRRSRGMKRNNYAKSIDFEERRSRPKIDDPDLREFMDPDLSPKSGVSTVLDHAVCVSFLAWNLSDPHKSLITWPSTTDISIACWRKRDAYFLRKLKYALFGHQYCRILAPSLASTLTNSHVPSATSRPLCLQIHHSANSHIHVLFPTCTVR